METGSKWTAGNSELVKGPDSGKAVFSSYREPNGELNMTWIFRGVLLLLLGAGGWFLSSIDHRIQKIDERLRKVEIDMGHIKGSLRIREGAGWSRPTSVTIPEK